jgi:mRNA interferase MazF
MFEFGSIVFVAFPFTDLSGTKLRPALIISRDNHARDDVVLAFVTSRNPTDKPRDAMPISPTPENGLRIDSFVLFDKLVTLKKELVLGKAGNAGTTWLASAKSVCHGVFGFE